MNDHIITSARLAAFRARLQWEEKCPGTIEKYCRDVAAFAAWLGERPLSKEAAGAWKAALLESGRAPATINAKLAAVNRFFSFLGRQRLALLLEAICATGIRVGEVRYLTVEAARRGRAEVRLKGKSAPSCCRASCAGSCCNTPKNRTPPPARSFSPEAEPVFPAGRSGRR